MADPKQTFDRMTQEYFNAVTTSINSIYVDMEMLQDLKLGALLTTLTVKEEMAYIYSQLPNYNEKLDLATAPHFPVLKKTDDELRNIMHKDPMKVAMLSPWTEVYGNLVTVLTYVIQHNKATLNKAKLLEIVVNCSDIDYPIELFDKFAKLVTNENPRVSIKLSHQKRYEATRDFYTNFDMFFLYDHETFLNNELLLDAYTTKDRFSSKIIYTLPLVNASLGIDKSEYAKALASTRATLDLFCDFFYMTGGIPLHAVHS